MQILSIYSNLESMDGGEWTGQKILQGKFETLVSISYYQHKSEWLLSYTLES